MRESNGTNPRMGPLGRAGSLSAGFQKALLIGGAKAESSVCFSKWRIWKFKEELPVCTRNLYLLIAAA